MAYIGKQPVVGNFQKCDAISVVNGQAAYTLNVGGSAVTPENANLMLVSLNGVLQAPGDSFTVSGSTLTFASNLATGDVIDFVIILGDVLDLGTPSDNSISTAKLVANSVTAAKFNADVISGQTALAETPADTDELLLSDAGVLKRIDYSYIKSSPTHVLISSSTTSSASSSIDITSGIDSTYKLYMIDLFNVLPIVDYPDFELNLSQGGSFITSSTYDEAYYFRKQNSTSSTGRAAENAAKIRLAQAVGNVTNEGVHHCRVFLIDPSNTNLDATLRFETVFQTDSDRLTIHKGVGRLESTTAVDGIRFIMSSGNIAAGAVVKLYGVT